MSRLSTCLALFTFLLFVSSAMSVDPPTCIFHQAIITINATANTSTTAQATYDLTDINNSITAVGGLLGKDNSGNYYYFQLCTQTNPAAPSNFPMQVPGNTNTVPTPGGCTGNSAGAVSCQLDGTNTYKSAGALTSQAVALTVPGNVAGGLTLTYIGGTGSTSCRTADSTRNSIYVLNCAVNITGNVQVTSITEAPQCNYTYQLAHASFCPSLPSPTPIPSPEGSRSGPAIDGGWIFIIILAGLVVIYLVVGIIIKIKKYDARGIEVIPNIEFWKDLPFLCKDGVMLIVNKIRGRPAYTSV